MKCMYVCMCVCVYVCMCVCMYHCTHSVMKELQSRGPIALAMTNQHAPHKEYTMWPTRRIEGVGR